MHMHIHRHRPILYILHRIYYMHTENTGARAWHGMAWHYNITYKRVSLLDKALFRFNSSLLPFCLFYLRFGLDVVLQTTMYFLYIEKCSKSHIIEMCGMLAPARRRAANRETNRQQTSTPEPEAYVKYERN